MAKAPKVSEPKSSPSKSKAEGAVYQPTSVDIEALSRIVHDANRALNMTQGDYSLQPWDHTTTIQQTSIRLGVKKVVDNPTISPEELHQAWVDFKISEGWKFGSEKNPVTKEHPNLVAYYDLDAKEKLKDELFIGIIRTILGHKEAYASYYNPVADDLELEPQSEPLPLPPSEE